MRQPFERGFFFALSIVFASLLSSCGTNKKIAYFQDVSPDAYDSPQMLALASETDLKIQPDDILQITIQSIDPELSNIMGATNGSEMAHSNNSSLPTGPTDNIPGFRVDKLGFIELPLAGKLQVAGLNTTEVKELVRSKAAPYYKSPVVNVRLANFKVTVLGEVLRPGTYSISNETITLLDAVGMAGDLTIYGKRENVLLIRKEKGQLTYIRFDLNKSTTFKSPYFVLHQGDVIYIEPNKSKIASTDVAKLRSYSLIATGISLLIVLLSRVNFN